MSCASLPYPFSRDMKAPARYLKLVGFYIGSPRGDTAMGYANSVESLADWFGEILRASDGMTDAAYREGYVVGWVPMTPAERKRSDEASKRARDAAAKRRLKKEERERAELARLQRKYAK